MLKKNAFLAAILLFISLDASLVSLPAIAQESTRTIEYQWPEGGHTTFEIPSSYRAVTYDAGEETSEGTPYREVYVLILSPEEYESWIENPIYLQGIKVNRVFDSELTFTINLDPIGDEINANGNNVEIYLLGVDRFSRNQYVGVVWGNQFVTVSFDENHREVAEIILNSFDYLR
jgi:hypothetical protein